MMLIKRASAALVIATMFGLSTAIAQTTPAPIKAPPKQLPAIEQGALDIVKAMSAKLAGAKTLHFQVRVQSEAPSIDGIAVIYTSNSEFTLQRPNKLTAVRTGQGNPSELIYDGQSVAVITRIQILSHSARRRATLMPWRSSFLKKQASISPEA